jgi:hypothetical protein
MIATLGACASPEAARRRDGGAGADPGNKRMVERSIADPQSTDTTLWPGRASAPVDRLERGVMPPPPGVSRVPSDLRAVSKE